MLSRLSRHLSFAPLIAVLVALVSRVDVATKALAEYLQPTRQRHPSRTLELLAAGYGISGGSGQDTSTYDAVLKDVYENGVKELLSVNAHALDMFEERNANEWGGRTVIPDFHIGRNQGVGAYAEMGAIPQAGRQQHVNGAIPMRFISGRIQLSKQVMVASNGPRKAFENAMDGEMRRLVTDIKAERARMIFGDGKGVLALVNGDPGTGTTVTVDGPGGVAGATNGSRFISPNMLVTFVRPATGAIVGSADETVSTVPAAGTTFTTGSAVHTDVADNDYVVRANKAGLTDVSDTSYNKEPMGLRGLVDDGTYVATLHGINRTTYPLFQSNVINVAGALSADVIQRAIDMADQRGEGNTDVMFMHHSVRRAYINLTDDRRRYMGGDSLDAGTKAAKGGSLSFGGIPIKVDKRAPYGMVFGCDKSTFQRYVEIGGEWADESGAVLKQVGSGTSLVDAYEAFYRIWDNFACDKPAANWRLDNVTATVAVVHVD